MFQDGSDGEPTGQRPERADAEARRRCAMPATIEETVFHERIESPGFGRPPIHAGPRPELIGEPARLHFTSDRGVSPARIRFPPDNFKHSLTLFSKSFSSFPRGTCSLSVCHPYLAMDEIHCPIWAAFPNNPTRRECLMRVIPPNLGSRLERLSANGSWSPNARWAIPATTKRVKIQPSLAATSVDVDSHLGQPQARSARESSIRPVTTAGPVIDARCERPTRPIIASNFRGLKGRSPSKKLAAKGYLRIAS
ncbi:Protein TAR1 [Capsicum chinense]|nr:Protein TAR1 [Capsicum chinense]